MKFSRLIPLINAIIILSGCAGGMGEGNPVLRSSGGPVVPSAANSITVSEIQNNTGEKALHGYLAPLIRDSIVREGRLTPVSADDSPDLVLNIVIVNYSSVIVKFDRQMVPVQKRISISMLITVKYPAAGRMILNRMKISGYKDFSEYEMPVMSEDAALHRLLFELADRVAAAVASGWYTDLMTPVEKGKR